MFAIELSPYVSYRYGDKRNFRIFVSALIALILLLPLQLYFKAFAAPEGLTQIMRSDAVRGSAKYLKYMNWYGVITNMSISIICIFCMAQCIVTFLATIGYYTAPNYWDMVDSIKQSGGGGGQGQGGGMSQNLGLAGGLDSIVDALNSMNINLKRYSDVSSEFESNIEISEYNSGWEYVVKKGPIMLVMLLFLNMGWKGVLQQIIASTVDAFTVYAQSLPYDRMVRWAEWKATQETGYEFTLGLAGTEEGKVKQRLAQQIFSKVMGVGRFSDREQITSLGANIEGIVAGIEEHFEIPEHLKHMSDEGSVSGNELAPLIWPQLTFTVGLSNSKAAINVNQGFYVNLPKLQEAGEHSIDDYDSYYVVVALRYTEHSNQSIFTESTNKLHEVENVQSIKEVNEGKSTE